MVTAVLGIDCATVPRKTGLALGELHDGVVAITRCGVGSTEHPPAQIAVEWLADRERVLLALDSPLGWPRALGASLHGHRAGAPIGANSNQLFRRAADAQIKQRLGKLPLEVGANLIARTAASALVLLDCIRRETGRAIPLAWAPDESEPWRVIEVYPAATRIAHGAPDVGGSLTGLGGLLDCSAVTPAVRASKDAADACVCALAAADFLQGRAIGPTDTETALIEGWIWAP
jgi:Protein of unknown function (DUF429)